MRVSETFATIYGFTLKVGSRELARMYPTNPLGDRWIRPCWAEHCFAINVNPKRRGLRSKGVSRTHTVVSAACLKRIQKKTKQPNLQIELYTNKTEKTKKAKNTQHPTPIPKTNRNTPPRSTEPTQRGR